MRYAIRRTQKQIDAERKSSKAVADMDYRELQALATKRGIPARQSAEALREQLS